MTGRRGRIGVLWLCLGGVGGLGGLLAVPGPARADEDSFEGTADAPILDDVVKARERALTEAMQHVLEQAVAQTAPEARGRLYLVSSRARDYVTTYRMLEEDDSGGQFHVRIQGRVDLPRLLRDLQMPARPAPPRARARGPVLVCPVGPGGAGDGEVLDGLRAALAAKGPLLPAASCPALDMEGAGALGQAMISAGAQLAVAERTTMGPTDLVRGTQPALYGTSATLRLSIYTKGTPSSDSAQRSGAPSIEQTQESFGFGDSPAAAARAARRTALAEALLAQRSLLSTPAAAPAGGVGVVLEGVPTYGDYQRLLKVLSAMPGVSRAEPRGFRGDQDGLRVEVQVSGPGPASTLGAALGRTPVPGLRLQVVPDGPDRLRVLVVEDSVLPAPPPPEPEGPVPKGAP